MTMLTTFHPPVTALNGSADARLASTGRPTLASNGARVLLVEQRQRDIREFDWAMRAMHLESSWVRCGLEGIAALRRTRFDVVLVDEELPDMTATDVVRTMRAEYETRRFVILRRAVTGRETATHTAIATRTADCDMPGLLPKPYRSYDLILVVNSILGLRLMHTASHMSRAAHIPASTQCMTPGSTVERWAHFVLGAMDAEQDPKTVGKWARILGVSRSVLSECCRLVHVHPQDARDFARLLRAICHSGEHWQPETVLDLADARTLRKVLTRAGLFPHAGRTPTTPQFLEQQQWIPQTNAGLTALRTLLFAHS